MIHPSNKIQFLSSLSLISLIAVNTPKLKTLLKRHNSSFIIAPQRDVQVNPSIQSIPIAVNCSNNLSIGFGLTDVSSQLTQTAVTKGIIVIKLVATRMPLVALLIATMTTITSFENIFKSILATPLTQAMITVATGNGFDSQTINDDDNTGDEYGFESNEVFASNKY